MFNYLIKWEKKYEADKTWAACRTYFIDAAEEIELEVTSESHGFYANFAKEFQAALLDVKKVLTNNKEQMANIAKDSSDKYKRISDLCAKIKEK